MEGYDQYEQAVYTWPRQDCSQLEEMWTWRYEDPEQVKALLEVRDGERLADVGCGSGYYTFQLAELVGPQGRVYALDVQEEAISDLRRRLAELPQLASRVTSAVNAVDDLGLEPQSVDVMLLAHLDFYLYPPLRPENRRLLASCAEALVPGGRLLVVQYLGQLDRDTASREIKAALAEAGLISTFDQPGASEPVLYLGFERGS